MNHVALLGDSIFDNAKYVPDRPPLIEQVQKSLPGTWRATLLAVDGDVTRDVTLQMKKITSDITHLVLSVSGNDALGASSILEQSTDTIADALTILNVVGKQFQQSYRKLLEALVALKKPCAVCTIYDAIPGLDAAEQTALAIFNEIILREAFRVGFSIIDLRLICNNASDYSHISSIEPSAIGGAKIATVITELLTTAQFPVRSAIFM